MNIDGQAIKLTGMPGVDILRRRYAVQGVAKLGQPATGSAVLSKSFGNGALFSDIWQAYRSDGYVYRAVNRLRQLSIGTGIRIEGMDEAVRYLNARFEISKSVNGFGFDDLIQALMLDYILYGNAFAVRAYTSQVQSLYGRKLSGKVAAAWYPISPRMLTPSIDNKTGEVLSWEMKYEIRGSLVTRQFKPSDVDHLVYNRGSDYLWGSSLLGPVIEDVRAFRQIEENILRLMHKFSNPIIVIVTPDSTGTGIGLRADMQVLADSIANMAEDGALVLMPGQEVRLLGAESHALRVEGYAQMFKKRIFGDLGMSAVMLADEPEEENRVQDIERQLYDIVLDIQGQFGRQFMYVIIRPLLEQAGFPVDSVSLRFQDPDPLATLRREVQLANLYVQNAITWTEMRQRMGLDPAASEKDTYLWRVQVPRAVAVLQAQVNLGLAGGGTGSTGLGRDNPDADLPKPRGRPSK